MKVEKMIAEVNRQLTLKAEITTVGPPHVVVRGDDILDVIHILNSPPPLEPEIVQELRRVHFLVQRLATGPKEMRPNPEEWALIEKWGPFDVVAILLTEVARLQRRVNHLQGVSDGR